MPGGVADRDGRLLPGDRLMFVNESDLEGSSLDYAVHVLKSTGYGPVCIGVAKPLPVCKEMYIFGRKVSFFFKFTIKNLTLMQETKVFLLM